MSSRSKLSKTDPDDTTGNARSGSTGEIQTTSATPVASVDSSLVGGACTRNFQLFLFLCSEIDQMTFSRLGCCIGVVGFGCCPCPCLCFFPQKK